MDEIRVKNSGLVPRSTVDEGGRGSLLVVEGGRMPFAMARVYAIHSVSSPGAARGAHAHKKTDQVIFIIVGGLTLHLDDGSLQQSLRLTSEDEGIRLGPMLWHSMSNFTADCVALLVASLPYDESDYIRDYEEFKKYARTPIEASRSMKQNNRKF